MKRSSPARTGRSVIYRKPVTPGAGAAPAGLGFQTAARSPARGHSSPATAAFPVSSRALQTPRLILEHFPRHPRPGGNPTPTPAPLTWTRSLCRGDTVPACGFSWQLKPSAHAQAASFPPTLTGPCLGPLPDRCRGHGCLPPGLVTGPPGTWTPVLGQPPMRTGVGHPSSSHPGPGYADEEASGTVSPAAI